MEIRKKYSFSVERPLGLTGPYAYEIKKADMPNMNSGDTAFLMMSAALAFLMVPGFALFYGGFSRDKDGQPVLSQFFAVVCLVLFQWILLGYSLAFGPDHGGWIGNLAYEGLRGVGLDPNLDYTGSVPHLAFMLYHGMCSVIPAVLILCACAERMKFGACCFFLLLW